MKKFAFIFSLFLPLIVFSQNKKESLDFSVYNQWNTLKNSRISNNGNFVLYEVNPYKGDSKLYLYRRKNKKFEKFDRGRYAEFSANSNYMAFRIRPQYDSIRKQKRKKVKKNKLPKDSLGIFVLNKKLIKFAQLKSFNLAKESSDWMCFNLKSTIDTTKSKGKKKKTKKFDKTAPKVSQFHIFNPILNRNFSFSAVSENSISRNGNLIAFNKLQNDTILFSNLYIFDTQTQKLDSIFQKKGLVKKIVCNNTGTQVAFLYSNDTIKNKRFALYLWNKEKNKTVKIVDTLSSNLPKLWTASDKGAIFFSRDDKRLFFGTALRPKPAPKDTLLPEEKVKVDVWSWTDKLLQTQQLVNLKKDKNKTYLTEYLISEKKLLLLTDTIIENINIGIKANNPYFLASSDINYQKQSSWNAPFLRDFYRINAINGKNKLILKANPNAYLSPKGNFLLYFVRKDSAWYIKNLLSNKTQNITSKLKVPFYEEDNDYPMLPEAYGFVNWEKNEKFILIYDRFDIWKINLDPNFTAVNITNGFGRKNSIRFHYMRINPEQEYITANETLFLRAFNEKTKQEFYYSLKNKKLHQLYGGDFKIDTWKKAKKASTLIFSRQSFQEFPNLWITNVEFKNPIKISDANPQQSKYLWGSVALEKWITMEGKEEEGLLYKPENFNPNKKYPMIVYFYRLSSDRLHQHHIPKPSRSIINPTFYTSNGYLVFIPNIRYKVGYPGKSSYDYVVGGTSALLNRYKFIDKKHLAIQGQSWGGYQVAYIVTQTDMFAAASAGAPVSNMTSAYGGIRWQTGMSRMFQYEKTQSRIGGTLWDKPLNYIENSPLFYAPQINTPLLIRHDDADGAVPWYQGIELFVALRRLNKPVWLLNYNGQPHNLKAHSPDCLDLSIRMMQFFDHYLKGKPAPVWMTKGIPAIMKGKTLGYEIDE